MDDWLDKKVSRKDFLKVAGTGLSLLALEGMLKKVSAEDLETEETSGMPKRRYAMVIDLQRCIGCQACTVACKVENNLPSDKSGRMGRDIAYDEMVVENKDKYPYPHSVTMPRPCFHCDNPSCTKVCPVGATFKDENNGLVLVSYGDCIGCRYCAVSCPYNVRQFNWAEPSWPKERAGTLNPDIVDPLEKGTICKCTFCVHIIREKEDNARSEERPVQDGEISPACCTTCMGKARYFGDLNNRDSMVSKLARSGRAFRVEEHLGNEPKVFYLK